MRGLLRHCRIKARVWPAQVARAFGLSRLGYQYIESGRRSPSVWHAAALERFSQLCCSEAGTSRIAAAIRRAQPLPRRLSRCAMILEALFAGKPLAVDYSWARHWEICRIRQRDHRAIAYATDLSDVDRLALICTHPADVARLFHLPDPGLPPWDGEEESSRDRGKRIRETNLFNMPALRPPRS